MRTTTASVQLQIKLLVVTLNGLVAKKKLIGSKPLEGKETMTMTKIMIMIMSLVS
jgi:hypothetical protein